MQGQQRQQAIVVAESLHLAEPEQVGDKIGVRQDDAAWIDTDSGGEDDRRLHLCVDVGLLEG